MSIHITFSQEKAEKEKRSKINKLFNCYGVNPDKKIGGIFGVKFITKDFIITSFV